MLIYQVCVTYGWEYENTMEWRSPVFERFEDAWEMACYAWQGDDPEERFKTLIRDRPDYVEYPVIVGSETFASFENKHRPTTLDPFEFSERKMSRFLTFYGQSKFEDFKVGQLIRVPLNIGNVDPVWDCMKLAVIESVDENEIRAKFVNWGTELKFVFKDAYRITIVTKDILEELEIEAIAAARKQSRVPKVIELYEKLRTQVQ